MKNSSLRKLGNVEEFSDGTMEVTIEFDPFTHGHDLGAKRNYNPEKYRNMVENESTQTRIANGYAIGFYGHDNRTSKRNHLASERDGKENVIFPCCKTLSMQWEHTGNNKGIVKHTQRILNNTIGKEIQQLIKSGVGGFSSVHDLTNGNFLGFDYVLSPNFTTNRVMVDNLCKNGMCGISKDSIETRINNDIKDNIKTYLHSCGVDDTTLVDTIYNLERTTSEYENVELMLDVIETEKRNKSKELDEVENRKLEVEKNFHDFIDNKYRKLVTQLDGLGFNINANDEIVPTDLGQLFTQKNFSDVVEDSIKNIGKIKLERYSNKNKFRGNFF